MITHSERRIYKCPKCDKSYSDPGSVTHHLCVAHQQENPKCDVCYKQYSCPTSLKLHMVTHTGEKPYKCPVCEQ